MANVDKVTEIHPSTDFNINKDGADFTRIYIVQGAANSFIADVGDDGTDRIQFVGEAHPDSPALFVSSKNAKPEPKAKKDVFRVTVKYATNDSEDSENPKNPEVGDQVWVYNLASGTEKIIAVKTPDDVTHFPANTPNKTQLIGSKGVDKAPEGTNILVPTLSLSVKKYLDSAEVPANDGAPFIQNMLAICKHVNMAVWHSWAIGEVLFLGLSLRPFNALLTEVTFNFSIKPGSARIKATVDPKVEDVVFLPPGRVIPKNPVITAVPFEGHQIREFTTGEKLFPISDHAAFGSDVEAGILSAHVFTIYQKTDFAVLDLGA